MKFFLMSFCILIVAHTTAQTGVEREVKQYLGNSIKLPQFFYWEVNSCTSSLTGKEIIEVAICGPFDDRDVDGQKSLMDLGGTISVAVFKKVVYKYPNVDRIIASVRNDLIGKTSKVPFYIIAKEMYYCNEKGKLQQIDGTPNK